MCGRWRMCGVDKAHFLENTSATEGAEELWCGQCRVLGFTFPPPVCLQVRGLCHRQEALWFLSAKKQEVRALKG